MTERNPTEAEQREAAGDRLTYDDDFPPIVNGVPLRDAPTLPPPDDPAPAGG